MKYLVSISLILVAFISIGQENNINRSVYLKGISNIDEAKFRVCSDTFHIFLANEDYDMLQSLEDIIIPGCRNSSCKYYCNRTFSEKFKTYIIACENCGSQKSLTLLDCSGDSIISQIKLSYDYYSGLGYSSSSSYFSSDSTFSTFVFRNMPLFKEKQESERDIKSVRREYLIKANGKIDLIEEEEMKIETNIKKNN